MITKQEILDALSDCVVTEGIATETPTPAEIRANLAWTKGQLERRGLIVAFDEQTQAFVDQRRKDAIKP
jgi:hypothetical protein